MDILALSTILLNGDGRSLTADQLTTFTTTCDKYKDYSDLRNRKVTTCEQVNFVYSTWQRWK